MKSKDHSAHQDYHSASADGNEGFSKFASHVTGVGGEYPSGRRSTTTASNEESRNPETTPEYLGSQEWDTTTFVFNISSITVTWVFTGAVIHLPLQKLHFDLL